MKYSKNFNRDYSFYLSNIDKFNFCGKDIEKEFNIIFNKDGMSAKECFFYYDSNGIHEFVCSEPDLLKALIICKGSVNLHIKMYAESMTELTLTTYELKDMVEDIKAPEWFYKSVMVQVDLLYRKKVKEGKIKLDYFTMNN